jgi:hypothetical protein
MKLTWTSTLLLTSRSSVTWSFGDSTSPFTRVCRHDSSTSSSLIAMKAVNTAEDVSRFVKQVNHPNVRALLNTYHMNIEESDAEKAFLTVQDCLEVVHFAASNRRAIGRGHIDFRPVVAGMKAIGFDKTIVLECPAPGPDPFIADKATRLRRRWHSMQRNRLLS